MTPHLAIYERDRNLLEFLERRAIRPGARLKVRTLNYDGTISLNVDGRHVELGGPAADKIWVVKQAAVSKVNLR